MNKKLKILLSGGGTGGHIYPAIAIADEIKHHFPNAEFLFIGANGKMEMTKVPQAGYKIIGLDIVGFNRANKLSNLKLPFKIISSIYKAKEIVKEFKPDFTIGTGGFASGPALYAAASFGIPVFIQEQNAHAGITNKILSKSAKSIFTAFPNVKGLPNAKIKFLGNPVRKKIIEGLTDSVTAKKKLNLDPEKITILSIGGSLGSRTLNEAWKKNRSYFSNSNYQLIWQTGSLDFQDLKKLTSKDIKVFEFINDMETAYSAADIIVSRAGAIAISELAIAQKPVILIPFPYAAEDHQTVNAKNLVDKNAARMVKDKDMDSLFLNTLNEFCTNANLRDDISNNLQFFAKPDATKNIVNEIINILNLKS